LTELVSWPGLPCLPRVIMYKMLGERRKPSSQREQVRQPFLMKPVEMELNGCKSTQPRKYQDSPKKVSPAQRWPRSWTGCMLRLEEKSICWPLSICIVLDTDSQLACVGVEPRHVLRHRGGPRGGEAKLVISRHTVESLGQICSSF